MAATHQLRFQEVSTFTRDARCLFAGSARLGDAIAARIVLATAVRLPEVTFDVAGPVTATLGEAPANVRTHAVAGHELFERARIGLCPAIGGEGDDTRAVEFVRAGLPAIVSPTVTCASSPELVDCWLVCSPDPHRLRDAIVESLDWDWSEALERARRFAGS